MWLKEERTEQYLRRSPQLLSARIISRRDSIETFLRASLVNIVRNLFRDTGEAHLQCRKGIMPLIGEQGSVNDACQACYLS